MTPRRGESRRQTLARYALPWLAFAGLALLAAQVGPGLLLRLLLAPVLLGLVGAM